MDDPRGLHMSSAQLDRETPEEFFARLDKVIEQYNQQCKAKRGDYVEQKPRPVKQPETNVIVGPWSKK